MKSVWICPSRSRPDNIARLIEAWDDLANGAVLVVAVDDDDPALGQYNAVMDGASFSMIDHVLGPRRRLGPTLNHIARYMAQSHDTIGFLGDDHLPRTVGFDTELHEAIQDQGGGLAYGNDLLQGENLPTAVLMDAAIVRSVGHFCPPGQIHLYLDDYWRDLGVALDKLTYCPDVTIEHMHPLAGKAERDDLYTEVNAGSMYAHDKAAYEEYRLSFFRADVARINSGLWA